MEVPSIFLNRILSEVAKQGASSLHLSVGSSPTMRVGGRLILTSQTDILSLDIIEKIIESIINEDEKKQLIENKEFVVVKVFAGNFRFRTNIFYQKGLPSLSFHYIPTELRSLDDLKIFSSFREILNLDSGLIIIAGVGDSGKTSTSATFIEEVNQTSKKYIITLEDPVEYLFVNKKSIIEQQQVGQDIKTYVDGLKHCLVEDADLVYIDEIKKDFSSVWPFILELASGNCLVILEMNASSSVRAIEKILNAASKNISLESARFSLADALVSVISQRLISGRKGQALAAEVLMVTSAVKALIREGKIYQLESTIQNSREEGMISLKKSIEGLVAESKISQDEVNRLNLDN